MRLTRKGRRVTRRVAAEQLLANVRLAEWAGACRVVTAVKRRHEYVLELIVRRPK